MQNNKYEAIRRAAQEQGYPVDAACLALHVSRAGYYRWRSGKISARAAENRRIADMVKEMCLSIDELTTSLRFFDHPSRISERLEIPLENALFPRSRICGKIKI